MTLNLLTPTMAGLLDRIRRARRPPLHALGVAEARAAYEAGTEVLDLPRAPLPEIAALSVAGRWRCGCCAA